MQAVGSSSPALNWATHWRRSAELVGGEQGMIGTKRLFALLPHGGL